MLRHRKIQRLLFFGIVLAIGLAAARFLAIQGFLAPVRVSSGSMYPWLRGERFTVTCQDCAFAFEVGVESPPREERPVCPNCGYDRNTLSNAERLRGQRVLIDRGAFWLEQPQRFDPVAFSDSKNERLVVKRVVALPGERLAIRRGELFIDGEMLRKTLDQFRVLAVTVHDNQHLPTKTSALPSRWRSDADETGWYITEQSLRFVPQHQSPPVGQSAPTANDYDWVTYHHWRCFASNYLRTAEAPISDNYGYNQGESRELQELTDIVVRFKLVSRATGRLAIRIHDGRDWIEVVLNTSIGSATVGRVDEQLAMATWPSDLQTSAFELEFGLLDGQIVLALDRREVLRQVYERSPGEVRATARPVQIGSLTLPVALNELVIRRDIYYLDNGNRGEDWEMDTAMPGSNFYLLGDNPPLSEDSRLWGTDGIADASLRGRVLPLPW